MSKDAGYPTRPSRSKDHSILLVGYARSNPYIYTKTPFSFPPTRIPQWFNHRRVSLELQLSRSTFLQLYLRRLKVHATAQSKNISGLAQKKLKNPFAHLKGPSTPIVAWDQDGQSSNVVVGKMGAIWAGWWKILSLGRASRRGKQPICWALPVGSGRHPRTAAIDHWSDRNVPSHTEPWKLGALSPKWQSCKNSQWVGLSNLPDPTDLTDTQSHSYHFSLIRSAARFQLLSRFLQFMPVMIEIAWMCCEQTREFSVSSSMFPSCTGILSSFPPIVHTVMLDLASGSLWRAACQHEFQWIFGAWIVLVSTSEFTTAGNSLKWSLQFTV